MKRIIIPITFLLLCLYTDAQNAMTNTGNLQIHSDGSITSFGDFTNTSTGVLVNNGDLYLSGNLSNSQSSMSAGTGTLYLNSTGVQAINGSQTFKTSNLSTNTSAGITLNNNLSVAGSHTYIAGTIASSATPNYLIYEAGSTHTGSSDAAHVTGWVKKYGTAAFTFPTGNGTYLRNIAISNLSASMEIDATYGGPTTNTTSLQSPLSSINPSEYWTLNNITAGATTAQVTLNWDNPKISFPNYVVLDIRSAQYTSGNWTSTGGTATGTTATTGSITSTALNVFGPMSIGSISFLVPLNFLSITAERKKEYTLVEWKTANEVNVKRHEVQRSSSITTGFATIEILPARNILNAQTYNFYDTDNLSGIIYYRIKSVDLDGKVKYSKVVSVSYNPSNESITLKNNPVQVTIYLLLTSKKNIAYNYQLIAANGSLVQQGNLPYGGSGSLSIALNPNIKKGTYILMLNDGKSVFTQKIIVD